MGWELAGNPPFDEMWEIMVVWNDGWFYTSHIQNEIICNKKNGGS